MAEIAQQERDAPVPLSQIAKAGNISLSYLEQLFAGLRRHGLVKSFRGPGGGYRLTRPAAEIEPQLLMFSSSRILPGPIRPFASRSIRTLRDGSDAEADDDLRI